MLEELAVYNQDYDLVGLVKIENGVVVGSVGVVVPHGVDEKAAMEKLEQIPNTHVVKGTWGNHGMMPSMGGGADYANASFHDDPWADAKTARGE